MTVKIENLQNLKQVDAVELDAVELTDEEMQAISGGATATVSADARAIGSASLFINLISN